MDFLVDNSSHQIILYFLHFLWSFLDWFIFSTLFITWEFFFLSWWYLSVEYLNIFIIYFSLVFWAVLWDNLSYLIWKKYWKKILLFKNIKFINENQLKKWANLLKKHWVKIIFFSRFIWPFYWLIPTIAGIFWFDYKKFFFFNFAGILIWVFQFMAYGYFFAMWFSYFWNSIFINILLFITFVYLIYLFFIRFKIFFKEKNYLKIWLYFIKYSIIYFFVFIFILSYYFFFLYPKDAIFYDKNNIIKNVENFISNSEKQIFSDKIIKINSNPINLVIISNKNTDEIMENIWWKKNLSFSSSNINISTFFYLLYKKEPPISDYYHNWFNQNSQYQETSKSNWRRNHIRFWEIWKNTNWKNIYIASISEDKNFSIMLNNWLPIIGHSIYRNTDLSRNIFIKNLQKNFENIKIKSLDFWKINIKNYFSDWKIYIIEI